MNTATSDDVTIAGGRIHGVVPPASHRTNDLREDRYEVLNEISRGGWGQVLRAFDRNLQCDVVLKRILPEVRTVPNVESRFLHEARITAQLAHPGIVPVHDLGVDVGTGLPFYTMKWLQGKTLAECIQAHHSLPPSREKERSGRELLVRFEQICETLSYAHDRNIIHRDLKPSNILIGEFGETIVLDWGLAKELDDPSPESPSFTDEKEVIDPPSPRRSEMGQGIKPKGDIDQDLTKAGAILGTAAYMSPEQARGDSSQVDKRADVFSLGSILYEILTGRSPFRCPTSQETLQHVTRAEFIPVRELAPKVPRILAAICEKALKLDPHLRYSDANELEQDIESYLAGESVAAFAEPWWSKLDRIATKNRALFWSGIVSLVVVTSVSVVAATAIQQAHKSEKISRQVAEQAHEEKAVALLNEKIAHREAVTQLQSARESVDHWLLELESDLGLYPGLKALRHHLLERADSHYSILANQQASSPVMALEIARAGIRSGDIDRVNQKYDASIEHYQHAIQQLEQIPCDLHSDWWAIHRVQWASAVLGLAHAQLESGGEQKNLLRLLESSREAMETIDTNSPEYLESQRLLARGHHLRGKVYSAQQNWVAAEEEFKKGLTLQEYLSGSSSTGRDRRTIINILEDLAECRLKQDHFAEAQESYQRIVHIYDRLLSEEVHRPDWLESRGLAKTKGAHCSTQLVQPNEAVIALEAGEEDLKNAWEIFSGESLFHDKLSSVYTGLGHAFLLGGDMEQAETVLKKSLLSLEKSVLNREPSIDHLQRVVQCRLWLESSLDHQGKPELSDSLKGTERLLERLKGLHGLDGSSAHLTSHHACLMARHHVRQNNVDDAESKIRANCTSLTETENDLQGNGAWHLWQGRLLSQMAKIHGDRSESVEAKDVMEKARAHWKRAHASQDRRMAAIAAFALIESWLEDESASEDDVKEASRLAREMVVAHETLPSAWFWVAETQLRIGQSDTAEEAFQKMQRLRRHATTEDRLLGALLRWTTQSPSERVLQSFQEELDISCNPGTHAAFLQSSLRKAMPSMPRESSSGKNKEEVAH